MSEQARALEKAERILRTGCGKRLRVGFPLAPLTTFRIGGPAALYLEAEDDGDLAVGAEVVATTGIPWIVIGKGSNILVSDRVFPGLVVRLGKGYRWAARDGERLHAGGSMPLPALAGVALSHSLSGLEFGVAIPASLGGAVRMNAGAHRGSMDQVLEQVELYSLAQAGRAVLSSEDAGFDYRRSALPEASIVVAATVHLHAAEPPDIRGEMEKARAWRRATQPLAEPNCGSVFKNPPGDHAARLVEAVGGKGIAVGGAIVSEKHSNFIVARSGATAADVHQLIRLIQDRVAERFGVALETEVQLIGDFDLAAL
ncbi:MAG TPA: UDP-N-acetylmuramate dehydrogenase [Actinomycetota bacterium]|nr:UDP-N-acetylmuramate dehydrogenase [Actinomycetota bacterium]